jgi:hypothetical protein
VLAIHHVAAPTRFTRSVFAGDQPDTDPLTDFPVGHARPQGLNATDRFVPRNARQGDAGVRAVTVNASV